MSNSKEIQKLVGLSNQFDFSSRFILLGFSVLQSFNIYGLHRWNITYLCGSTLILFDSVLDNFIYNILSTSMKSIKTTSHGKRSIQPINNTSNTILQFVKKIPITGIVLIMFLLLSLKFKNLNILSSSILLFLWLIGPLRLRNTSKCSYCGFIDLFGFLASSASSSSTNTNSNINMNKKPFFLWWMYSSFIDGFLLNCLLTGGILYTRDPIGLLFSYQSGYFFSFLSFIMTSMIMSIRILLEHRPILLHEVISIGLWRKLSKQEANKLEKLVLTESTKCTNITTMATTSTVTNSASSSAAQTQTQINDSVSSNIESKPQISGVNNAKVMDVTVITAAAAAAASASNTIVNTYVFKESEQYMYLHDDIVAIPTYTSSSSSSSSSVVSHQSPSTSTNRSSSSATSSNPTTASTTTGSYVYYQLMSAAAAPAKAPYDNTTRSLNGWLQLWLASHECHCPVSDSPMLHTIIIILGVMCILQIIIGLVYAVKREVFVISSLMVLLLIEYICRNILINSSTSATTASTTVKNNAISPPPPGGGGSSSIIITDKTITTSTNATVIAHLSTGSGSGVTAAAVTGASKATAKRPSGTQPSARG